MPSVNISTLLTTIRLLMAEPNADDGLMPEITDLFKHNRELFDRKAADHTREHATKLTSSTATSSQLRPSATSSSTEQPTSIQHDGSPKVLVHVPAEAAPPTQAVGKRVRDEEDSFSGSDSSEESDFSQDEDDISTSKRRRFA